MSRPTSASLTCQPTRQRKAATHRNPPSRRPPHAHRPVARGRRRRTPPSRPTAPSHVGVAAEPHRRADRPVPRGRRRRNPPPRRPPPADRPVPRASPTNLPSRRPPPADRPVPRERRRRTYRRADRVTPTVLRGRRRRSPTVTPTTSRPPHADRPVARGRRRSGRHLGRKRRTAKPTVAATERLAAAGRGGDDDARLWCVVCARRTSARSRRARRDSRRFSF
jgi:hypothetical protein